MASGKVWRRQDSRGPRGATRPAWGWLAGWLAGWLVWLWPYLIFRINQDALVWLVGWSGREDVCMSDGPHGSSNVALGRGATCSYIFVCLCSETHCLFCFGSFLGHKTIDYVSRLGGRGARGGGASLGVAYVQTRSGRPTHHHHHHSLVIAGRNETDPLLQSAPPLLQCTNYATPAGRPVIKG
jgi:hypothetical protein